MMQKTLSIIGLISGTLALIGAAVGSADDNKPAQAAAPTPQQVEFFENKVRPVLFDNCFSCHGEKMQMGSLRLDSMAHIMKGNSAGPAVIAGEPDKSPLIQVIRFDGKVKMPPAGKMKAEDIAVLTEWVKMGAPWPGVKPGDLIKPTANPDGVSPEMRKFWSFQPVKKPAVPKIAQPAKGKSAKGKVNPAFRILNPIDNFVIAKLQAKGIPPAPPADKRALIRRATYDLTGLPPTAEEIDAFARDKSPNAFAKVVDRLLASPRYGERWGRYWLDVARYSDTKGYVFTEDINFYNAYTYRDYVIQAFNDDLPYDQFIIQQLAADRLELGEDRRPLAALGFLTIGRRFLNDKNLIVDDQIDVTTRGLLGLSVGCARCHDHKFDPIPAKDYYSLHGIFASTQEQNPPPGISPKNITEPYEAHIKSIRDLESQRDNILRGQMRYLRDIVQKTPDQLPEPVKKVLQAIRERTLPDGNQQKTLSPHFQAEARENIEKTNAEIAALQKNTPQKPDLAMAVQDMASPVEPYVFIRGNAGNRGDKVPRRFLAVLTEGERKPYTQGSGRLELAKAIASKENPLTARVFVNRVWMYHFDKGIVRTPGDFGTRGDKPTHPQLLDWLAATFMENGWSVKKLHRTIMLSATYQQSSGYENARAAKLDPDNFLLWRQNRQRLDLEALRDSLLAATGQIDLTMGGKSVELTTAPFTKRRTVYGFVNRNNLQGFYRTFDFASPDMCMMQRPRTTVPQQALFMMNSPFVVELARELAKQAQEVPGRPTTSPQKVTSTNKKDKRSSLVVGRSSETMHPDAPRITYIYRKILGRAPTKDEIALGLEFLKQSAAPLSASVWQYGYGGYDEKTQRVTGFTPLAHFTGQGYQGGANMPDPKLQFLLLTAEGGHVGADPQHAAIRRWTAPMDCTVTIRGTLAHNEQQGDGVQARIVASNSGALGYWSAFKSRIETSVEKVTVKKGETLDFVVDCRSEHSFDSFRWAPTIRVIASGAQLAAQKEGQTWAAKSDFGAPITASENPIWDRYVHALLMTNEFAFVD